MKTLPLQSSWYSDETVAASMSLQSARSNLKKTLGGPTDFVTVGSLANEYRSELRGFQRPYKNSLARMVIFCSNV